MGYETFLKINGIPIPVESVTESAERVTFITSSPKSIVRRWEITTTPLPPIDAAGWEGLLKGYGDHIGPYSATNKWDNNITNIATTDKGSVPTQGVATLCPYQGPYPGMHALWFSFTTTNLLSAELASFENYVSGWNFYSKYVTYYFNGTFYQPFHGNSYLEFRLTQSGDTGFGMQLSSPISVTYGTTYTFSWYECHNFDLSSISGEGSYAPPAIIWYSDSSGTTEISRNELTNLRTAKILWHRHSITATAPTGAVTARLRIGWDSPDLTNNTQRYGLDALQFEAKDYASAFVVGSRSSIANVIIPMICENINEITLFFWVYVNKSTGTRYICLGTTGIYFNSTAASSWIYRDNTGIPHSSSNIPLNAGWNSLALVFKRGSFYKFYVNGQVKWSDTSVDYSIMPYNSLQLDNTTYVDYLISNLYVFPFAMSDSQIAGLHSQTKYTKHPYVVVEGDITKGEQVVCLPELTDTDMLQYYDTTYGATIGRKLKFRLNEVYLP